MLPSSSPTPRADEINLQQVFDALRRRFPLIALSVVLATGGTYAITSRQAPTYESMASVVAADTDARNTLINNTLVTAPPLPQGAVEAAMQSPQVTRAVIAKLEQSDLPAPLVERIKVDLQNGLADNRPTRFKVKSRLNPQQRGVYELRATAESPEAARVLAQSGTDALLAWDTDRAQLGVTRARSSLQAQLHDLTGRIAQTAPGSLERESLVAARGQLLQSISQVSVLESAATGTLSLISEPVAPRRPVAPNPKRNAALAGLLALFLASGLVLLLDSFRRKVNGVEDVVGMGLPVLGQLPLVPRKRLRGGFLAASKEGELAESMGFLRINIVNALGSGVRQRLVVSSAHPSEGKSSGTAALAASLASSGLRVLVIDADLRRPSQLKLWNPQQLELVPLPGSTPDLTPASTLEGAVAQPHGAHAVRVGRGVDLLPSGTGVKGETAAAILNDPALPELLDRWSQAYDVTLIDSPPMMSLPDTLSVARHADGILMIVEVGKTSVTDLERTIGNARNASVPVLGLALNRLPQSRNAYSYYYGYGQASASSKRSGIPSILEAKK